MKRIFSFVLVVFLGSVTSRAFASVTMYMRIKDASGTIITGESVAANFIGWTELKGYYNSITSDLSIGTTGTSIGKPNFNDYEIHVPLSSISLPISKLLTAGTKLGEVDIWFVKSNAPLSCTCAFYKVHMEDVYISKIAEAVDETNETVEQEIDIKPSKIAWAYYKVNNTGTYPSTPTNQHSWDLTRSAPFSYSF